MVLRTADGNTVLVNVALQEYTNCTLIQVPDFNNQLTSRSLSTSRAGLGATLPTRDKAHAMDRGWEEAIGGQTRLASPHFSDCAGITFRFIRLTLQVPKCIDGIESN